MKPIEIFLQGEGIGDIELIVVETGATARHLLQEAAMRRKNPVPGEFFVFIEGEIEALHHDAPLPHHEPGKPIRAHVHRCHSITTTVTFNGKSVPHKFSPSTTVFAVKEWAALKAFHMTPADAAEHVLQISGTNERPEPDTHIGTLAKGPGCEVRFDLVPAKRVEG